MFTDEDPEQIEELLGDYPCRMCGCSARLMRRLRASENLGWVMETILYSTFIDSEKERMNALRKELEIWRKECGK